MATKNFNRDFFNAILSNVDIMTLPSGMTAGEMREWATHQIDLLNRKNINKKPTATQEAADGCPVSVIEIEKSPAEKKHLPAAPVSAQRADVFS